MELVDTHCHIDEETFAREVPEVIGRARDLGVTRMVTIGTSRETCRRAVALAAEREEVYAAVGLHPNYVAEAQPGDWEAIVGLVGSPKVVALGETGLDRYWDHSPLELQEDYFRRHLTLSRETGLPFIVHCREAEADVLRVLEEFARAGPLNGIMHSFAGTAAAAERYLAWGMYLSFSGMVTYKKNEEIRQVAATMPLDRILVETDAPYLAPTPMRGKRNEPAYVRYTAGQVADLRGMDKEAFAAATTANARRVFRLG